MKRLNITVDFSKSKFSGRISAKACLARPVQAYQQPTPGTLWEGAKKPIKGSIRCGNGEGYTAASAMSDALEGLRTNLSFRGRTRLG